MRLCLPGTNCFSRVRPLNTIQPLSSHDYQHSVGETETFIDTFFFVIYFAFYLSAKKRRGNKENHYQVLSNMTILKDANEKFLSTKKNTPMIIPPF